MNEELICLCGSKCPEEIVKLRQQLEQAEARVAGLECVLAEIARRDKSRQYESCPDCFHKCDKETGCKSMMFSSTGALANGAVLGRAGEAAILRKQAEAVESWVNGFGNRDRAGLTEYAGGFCDGLKSATQSISAYAQHLHKQADEAEKENPHA